MSGRNKTLDINMDSGVRYLKRCIKVDHQVSLSDLLDKTIAGDTFQVLKFLPEKSIDLVIADPPYNLDKDFNGVKFKKQSDDLYLSYTDTWVKLVLPLLKDDASVYVCCDWKCSSCIEQILKKHLVIQNRITWQREKGRGALRNWKNCAEDIWFAVKSKSYTFNIDAVKERRKVRCPYRVNGAPKDWEATKEGNFRNTCPSNFWNDITVPLWSMPENTAHPTQKPEKLLAKLILTSSNCGEVVLDPFVGSGSTSVTARKLGRHYIGIEINPQYCIYAEKRLEMADTDKGIQGYIDGVFWERNSSPTQKLS